MKATALAAAGLALAACHDAPLAPAAPSDGPALARAVNAERASTVAGRYVVRLRDHVSDPEAFFRGRMAERRGTGRLTESYGQGIFPGFAAELSAAEAAAFERDPEVLAIEPDQEVTGEDVQSSAPWGLDRIDQRPLPLSSSYSYAYLGSAVRVYVLDTGINYDHVEFGGRAVKGIDKVTSGGSASDCNGHGTHVAGVIGGKTYGAAKGVKLYSVRVLRCDNTGAMSTTIAGIDWVAAQKRANPSVPMVANLSLAAGMGSSSFDTAVRNAVAAGVVVVVAAGNSSLDACTISPARVAEAITVGASGSSDQFASFSNRGSCVDLVAPGMSIKSAYTGSTTATRLMSGTSMASPSVAGAAALVLAKTNARTPAGVQSDLKVNATTGKLTSLPSGTANRLLNTGFLGS